MFRKIYLTAILGLFSVIAFAQTGTLKGTITDKSTGKAMGYINVIIEKDGNQIDGTVTDGQGDFTIKPIEPGIYTVKASFIGYTTFSMPGVVISANRTTSLKGENAIQMTAGVLIDEVDIRIFRKPLIDQNVMSGETKTSEEILAVPTKSINSIAAATAGVYQRDEGDALNMRGSRSSSTAYMVDGVRVRGSLGVPTSAIEQMTVVTGGLPAKYGDVTGGIIEITTKGPSNKFYGGIEYETSALFDDYNYHLIGGVLSGPLLRKTNADGTKGNSIIGFFISGEIRKVDDTDPSAIGVWKVKDDVLKELKATPFQIAPNAAAGFLSTSDFLTEKHYENVQAKQNMQQNRYNFTAKLDIKPAKNTFLSLSATHYNSNNKNSNYWRSMFSWDNNSNSTQKTWRAVGKLTQKFGDEESNSESSSNLIKNAFFTVQYNYTNNYYETFDARHEYNLFDYGYVGKFTTERENVYSRFNMAVYDTANSTSYVGKVLLGWRDTSYTFDDANTKNPEAAAYTNAYYDIYSQYNMASQYISGYGADGVIRTPNDLQGQGLRNGDGPANVYSLFGGWGARYNGAYYAQNNQQSFKFASSADIGDHEISMGFEQEYRKDMAWSVGTTGLWGLMRSLTNRHILERDLSDPLPLEDENGIFLDTINYNRLFIADEQSVFDQNLRETYNYAELEFIDIDELSPEDFQLNWFSPSELINNGSAYVSYYGYDAYGQINNNPNSLAAFFGTRNADGDLCENCGSDDEKIITVANLDRNIAAFAPTYSAGYIQDKFAINDLMFNIGLRISNYDANQMVLKDKYLMYNPNLAGTDEAKGLTEGGSHPSAIGDNFVVYVDDVESPTKIVGYRNGDDWYNSVGTQISDPTLLSEAADGKIAPLLSNPEFAVKGFKTVDAFKDYEPQLSFMPRIAFSFPISDEAQFFAHYDVLTQRPSANRIEPMDYLFMESQVGALLNNPDLKPEKTIDYEIGFAKKLTISSALKMSLFYKEMRDMVQVTNVLGAYPATYMMYQNIDFGTAKGFSISYDLRRTGRIQMTSNYTIQFADGTGSSASSGYSLVNTGQPNLRTTIPLSNDQRHAISSSVDYRYKRGDKYKGPVIGKWKILEDAGANIMLSAGSGTPYSRQSNVTQEAASGINDRSTLDGSINGSRLPWQFRMNAKFNKNFEIKWSKTKSSSVNAYLQIQNLFDARNVISVYRATGNPEDDGYLTATESQNDILARNNPESFIYLYSLAVNNPSHYSLPRMFRMGLTLTF